MTAIATIALAAFYLTRLLRKLSSWLAARKPVGCNECMSAWASLALLAPYERACPWRWNWAGVPWLTVHPHPGRNNRHRPAT